MIRLLNLILFVLLSASLAQAISIKDYSPYEYKVLFTNPVCKTVKYKDPTYSIGGDRLYQKPKNVFCRPSDISASARRPESPQNQMIRWIKDPQTKEIFFTYLSFSDSSVAKALCEAVEKRNLKLTFILDNPQPKMPESLRPIKSSDKNTKITSLLKGRALKKAKPLLECKGTKGASPTLYLRGNQGGFGYAHNKLMIINPQSKTKMKFIFSSGNLSSGTVIHHENWHFLTTSPESYFAQSQLCLMKGMKDHGLSKPAYNKYMNSCLGNIESEPEEDIQVYFAPYDAHTKAISKIANEIEKSDSISLAVHRFWYGKLIGLLRDKLKKDPEAQMRLVADDDIYWIKTRFRDRLGSNFPQETKKLWALENLGMEVKYMQTNQWYAYIADRSPSPWIPTIHHNKYIIFSDKGKTRGVFTGAGNFTGAAFTKNYENFYFISIPEVLEAFENQYEFVWNDMASWRDELPKNNAKP